MEGSLMAGSATATIDHDEIRAWVEARSGYPARVKRGGRDGQPGLLRIDYEGASGVRGLEPISWDDFFDWFERNKLAFLHQDTTASGRQSRFCKLVRRDEVYVEPRPRRADDEDDERAAEGEQLAGDPAELIEQQHDQVRELFAELEWGDLGVAPDLLNALALHLELEEAIVYPALLEGEIEEEIRESIVEHIAAKRLIHDLVDAPVADAAWWASLRVLRRQVEEHMEREEELVLPVLRERLDDEQQAALRQEMEAFTIETLEASADAPLESALSNTEARLVQP
jgi:hypothetical protein